MRATTRLAMSLVVVLEACTAQPPQQSGPVIGAILATTGPADFIGKPEAEVLRALMADYDRLDQNPSGVTLEILDSASDPGTAQALFNKFCDNQRVVAVIGPSTSGESIPVAQRASEREMPLLSLAASRRIVLDEKGQPNRWAFKFAQNDSLAAERLVRSMAQEGHRSVAVLYSDDGFGKSGVAEFKRIAAESGLTLLQEAAFPSQLTSPESFVASLPSQPDAVLIWGTAPGPALLIKSLRASKVKSQIYLSHGNASGDFLASAGTAAEGAIIVGSRVLLNEEALNSDLPLDRVVLQFRHFWQARGFRGEPSHFGGHARDALEALMRSIDSAASNAESIEKLRRAVRSELENLTAFAGVTGNFSFGPDDHAGLSIDSFATYRVSNGSFKLQD